MDAASRAVMRIARISRPLVADRLEDLAVLFASWIRPRPRSPCLSVARAGRDRPGNDRTPVSAIYLHPGWPAPVAVAIGPGAPRAALRGPSPWARPLVDAAPRRDRSGGRARAGGADARRAPPLRVRRRPSSALLRSRPPRTAPTSTAPGG